MLMASGMSYYELDDEATAIECWARACLALTTIILLKGWRGLRAVRARVGAFMSVFRVCFDVRHIPSHDHDHDGKYLLISKVCPLFSQIHGTLPTSHMRTSPVG